jgi:hypothetical protein
MIRDADQLLDLVREIIADAAIEYAKIARECS